MIEFSKIENFEFLGPVISKEILIEVAEGRFNPVTY